MEFQELLEKSRSLKGTSKLKAFELILQKLNEKSTEKEIGSTFKEVMTWVTELCD